MTSAVPVIDANEAMVPRPFRLIAKKPETIDTMTLVFEDFEGGEASFGPGQFMMLYVFGIGEVPISVAGNPHIRHSLEHTVRTVGPVTDALCALEPGDVIGIRGPYGTEWPIGTPTRGDLLIIAGGIGLAPLRPAVLEALNRQDEFDSISLLYGARTPADLLYKDDLLGWESTPNINVEITVDQATSDWWGDVGLVTSLLPRLEFQPANTTAFVCGPEVMMRVVARDLVDRGIPIGNIWVSLERNMKCAVGFCGHCQYGSDILCRSGPVVQYQRFENRLRTAEI